MNQINTGTLNRFLEIDRAAVDEEARTVRLSFSSEEPVERFFGVEVLDHQPQSVRMERLNKGAPLLWMHNPDDQIGRVESATINNGRGEAVVRFSKNQRADDFFRDVLDDISTNISVGYRIHKMDVEDDEEEGKEVYRATDWEPHEISLVSTPADTSVGIGRELEGEHLTRVFNPKLETKTMSEETTIDVQAVRDEAREAFLAEEDTRISTIQQAANDAPYLRELADAAIAKRMPLNEFQLEALEVAKREMRVKPVAENVSAPLHVDMSNNERSQYSVLRAVQAQVTGNWKNAGLEAEVSRSIAGSEGDTTGFYIPMNAPWGAQRDLTAGTNNQGGFLVPTDHRADDFVAALRANMVAGQAGATYLTGLSGNVAIPTIATGTAVGWVAEGAAPTEGQPVFGQISLTPKNLVGYVEITRNLMLQSSPAVETVVQQDITNALAVGMDAAALAGSGSSNQPTGILSTSGIGSVSFSSSGAPTFAEMVAIETAITTDNAATTDMVYVTTPALNGYLKTATKDSGSGRFISENGEVNGYRMLNTSSVTANNVILGNFNDLIIAQFGAIEVLTQTAPSTGITTMALHLHMDLGVRHAQSFAKGA